MGAGQDRLAGVGKTGGSLLGSGILFTHREAHHEGHEGAYTHKDAQNQVRLSIKVRLPPEEKAGSIAPKLPPAPTMPATEPIARLLI